MNTLIEELRAVLGEGGVLTGDDIPPRHGTDWSGLSPILPLALLRPVSTSEVSAAMAICHRHDMAVTPQGGLTGLVGGARPSPGSIALSTERLVGIEEIDVAGATMVVLAGTPLETVQRAADEAGLFFALDIGSRGSCTIGGNIATNAGGNRVLRYGMTRDLVLGLEAVLADGTVIPAMNRMIKNNTGLDPVQLFVGGEGLTGIITRAVLRLHTRPASVTNAFCRCPDFPSVLALLKLAQQRLAGGVTSFEAMWPNFYNFVIERMPERRPPLPPGPGINVIIEASGADADSDEARLEQLLIAAFDAGVIEDAVIAKSEAEVREFWAIRHAGAEYDRILGKITSFDISFPNHLLGEVAARAEAALKARWPEIIVLEYGHVGDGNIHVVVNLPGVDEQPGKEISEIVYAVVRAYRGSISAEHGIGTRKLPYLGYSRSPAEIALIRSVKAALDPKGILNPGKMLPPEGTSQ